MNAWLPTIVAAGGIGALIDFWLGKAGQRRVRTELETWWIKASYANLSTFGRAEASATAVIARKVFGSVLSVRRYIAIGSICLLGALTWFLLPKMPVHLLQTTPNVARWLLIQLAELSISISMTIWLCDAFGRRLPERTSLSFPAFVCAIAIQLALVAGTSEVIHTFNWAAAISFPKGFSFERVAWVLRVSCAQLWNWHFDLPLFSNSPTLGVEGCLSFLIDLAEGFALLFRIGLAGLFLLSFTFKPLAALFLGVLYRLIESEKPIFTLLFGAAAALAKAIQELVFTS